MEEEWIADRAKLREALYAHPQWSIRQLTEQLGRSPEWVKKWKKRLQGTSLTDQAVLRSQSRRRKTLPAAMDPQVEEAILRLRDEPPAALLHRVAGPRTILYYLQQEPALQQAGLRLPHSTSTIWKVLNRHQRILRTRLRQTEPLPRVAPMQEWELDFADIPTIPPQADGKRQHVVEALNVVDCGSSILVGSVARADYDAEQTLLELAGLFIDHGLPQRVRFDRDPRLIGGWSANDFPSALMRFLLSLGVQVEVCPPRRPDRKPFIERFNRTMEYECIRPEHPTSVEQARSLLERYRPFYNEQRPHQGPSCANRPPRVAFPTAQTAARLPQRLDPDHWLQAWTHRHFTRRVSPRGSISIGRQDYYISRALRGRRVLLRLQAAQRLFEVELDGQVVKRLPLKGLVNQTLSFEDYLDMMQLEARSEQRWVQARHRLRRI